MIRDAHNDVYGRILSLDLWVDAKCLWDCVTGIKTTTEKRLFIDLATMRDSYEVREITNVYWFPTDENTTNALTKRVNSATLHAMIT